MRGWIGTVLAAAAGGAIATATLLGTGMVEPPGAVKSRLSALPTASAPGALTAREIYRRRAPGVVLVTARALRGGDAATLRVGSGGGVRARESAGSGLVLDDDGLILTNAHVVAAATDIRVTFSGAHTVAARPVGTDAATDLALLRVEPDDVALEPLELGDSDALQVGDPIVAIGNPTGLERTLSTGVVSARPRQLTGPGGLVIDDVIQTDAGLDAAASGGPLLDAAGRVVGINALIAGVGFAVPVNTVKAVIPELERAGRVERAR